MNIFDPTTDDYSAIANIFNQAILPFYEIYTKEEKQAFTLQENSDSISQAAQSRRMICAKDANSILCGFAAFRKKNNNVTWISSLYVLPEYQKKGVGLLLLNSIEQYAQAQGCKVVALETHEKAIRAINFYLRSGYETINNNLSDLRYRDVLERPPIGLRPILAKVI